MEKIDKETIPSTTIFPLSESSIHSELPELTVDLAMNEIIQPTENEKLLYSLKYMVDSTEDVTIDDTIVNIIVNHSQNFSVPEISLESLKFLYKFAESSNDIANFYINSQTINNVWVFLKSEITPITIEYLKVLLKFPFENIQCIHEKGILIDLINNANKEIPILYLKYIRVIAESQFIDRIAEYSDEIQKIVTPFYEFQDFEIISTTLKIQVQIFIKLSDQISFITNVLPKFLENFNIENKSSHKSIASINYFISCFDVLSKFYFDNYEIFYNFIRKYISNFKPSAQCLALKQVARSYNIIPDLYLSFLADEIGQFCLDNIEQPSSVKILRPLLSVINSVIRHQTDIVVHDFVSENKIFVKIFELMQTSEFEAFSESVEYIVGMLKYYGYEDEIFDQVLELDILENISDMCDNISEAYHGLKPSKKFYKEQNDEIKYKEIKLKYNRLKGLYFNLTDILEMADCCKQKFIKSDTSEKLKY